LGGDADADASTGAIGAHGGPQMLYLSQAIGRPVLDGNGEPIGKVADLIVAVGDRYPPVTGLVVETDRRKIFLPWTSVASFDLAGARLATSSIDIAKFEQRPNEIRLKDDLMDKQIVDIDGRKVVRVNDLRLDEIDGRLRLVAVDVGAAGLLRRLGFEAGFRILARNLRLTIPERYIDWKDVDPVESSIASVKLRVPHQGLAELHPADLAAIIDRLAPRDRAGVLASLDDEAVADAMEEMEPDTQVEVLEDLDRERAADILEEMSPDDAADLVADLDQDVRDDILRYMEPTEAEEVQELLGYPEDTAGGIMTTAYIAVGALESAGGAIELLREWEPDAETIYYVYVTDEEDRLVGVLSLRDLIVARPETPIADVMIHDPVAVRVLADQDEVAEVVAHYNLLAVPVVDDDRRLVGIVTIDDAIDTVIPTAWKKRLPRIFSGR
jgi:magnesium transporter